MGKFRKRNLNKKSKTDNSTSSNPQLEKSPNSLPQSLDSFISNSKISVRAGATTYSSYDNIILDNERFKLYYQSVGVISSADWDTFYDFLKKPLLTTFRITGNKEYAKLLRDRLTSHYFKPLNDLIIDNQSIPIPVPIPWYPDNLAWILHAGRNELKRSSQYAELHKFIVQETDLGNISRQEAVSMIPPLFLDLSPSHLVLDMCAAPGSKTCQLIEILHGSLSSSSPLNIFPTGAIIANDIDEERSHMLIHQLKRMHSPSLIVTNHDASVYPSIVLAKGEQLQFDRILCDVPCSGDGTIRKNKLIWKNWHRGQGYGLHPLQIDILTRGCELLKVGGRLVYSTCSLNPIENEAVLFHVLKKFKGSLVLVDVSDQLTSLKRSPGLSSWKVQMDDRTFIDTFSQDHGEKIKESFFPPTATEASEYSMHRSIRIYPHFQNTGGFFIAVIEKLAPLHANLKKYKEEKGLENIDDNSIMTSLKPSYSSLNKKKTGLRRWTNDDPFIFQTQESQPVKIVKNLYGLCEDAFPFDQLMIRSVIHQERNNLFLVSKSVKSILESPSIKKLNVQYSGIKTFTRCDGGDTDGPDKAPGPDGNEYEDNVGIGINSSEKMTSENSSYRGICPELNYSYRIQNEAIPLISKFITARRVTLALPSDFALLLDNEYPYIELFSSELASVLSGLPYGCHIFKFNEAHTFYIEFPVWKGKTSVNLLVNKKERLSIKERWLWMNQSKN